MIEQGSYKHQNRTARNGANQSLVNHDAGIKRILRSIGAVLLGLVATVFLSVGTDVLMHVTRIYPPWGEPMQDSQYALATVYRSVYAVVGSYVAAWLAPNRPMLHALVLGAIGFVLALIGTVTTWNAGPAYARKWYPITLILISIPCAWLGGKLSFRQSEELSE